MGKSHVASDHRRRCSNVLVLQSPVVYSILLLSRNVFIMKIYGSGIQKSPDTSKPLDSNPLDAIYVLKLRLIKFTTYIASTTFHGRVYFPPKIGYCFPPLSILPKKKKNN